jgi:hypothetical protein
MPVTYYVALPFTDSEEGPMPGQAVECQSHGGAISAARTLSSKEGNVGALAFSRTGEPELGEFTDATVLKTFGLVPKDFEMAT